MMQTFTRIFGVILFLGVLWVDFDMEKWSSLPSSGKGHWDSTLKSGS